jgi:hypothetical protein
MLVSIRIDNDEGDKFISLDNCNEDESKVLICICDDEVKISIEELKHALRKISCK